MTAPPTTPNPWLDDIREHADDPETLAAVEAERLYGDDLERERLDLAAAGTHPLKRRRFPTE